MRKRDFLCACTDKKTAFATEIFGKVGARLDRDAKKPYNILMKTPRPSGRCQTKEKIRSMFKKILPLVLALSLLLTLLGALSSCGDKLEYDGEEEFVMGGFSTAETVTAVEILWVKGSVTLSGTLSSKVSVKENYPYKNDGALRYRLKDGVLQIYPCASGADATEVAKDLTVEIPYEMAYALESVKITAQGDVPVGLNMIEAKTLDVTTVSGDVHFKGRLQKANVTTESGSFTADSIKANDLRFTSETGNATLVLHLSGFTAVMQNGEGSFETGYEAHRNGSIYTFGTQTPSLIFDTAGKVTLSDVE